MIIYETAYAGENVFEAFKQRYSDKLVHFELLYCFSNWNKILSNRDTNNALMKFEGLVKNVANGFYFIYKYLLNTQNMSTARNEYARNSFANVFNKEILLLLLK